jgi:UDP-N-acetylglucosamine 1-carboxyvinyltransferase
MGSFVVEGGHKLSGVIHPQGAKNEALQIISAVLMTEEEVTVSNMTFIDKQSLIDYLCGEGYYTKQKPQAFKDLLKNLLNK